MRHEMTPYEDDTAIQRSTRPVLAGDGFAAAETLPSVPASRDGADPSPTRPDRGADPEATTSPSALVRALFEGLSADDRAWVVQRIRHYRTLAAADQAPEGRF